MKLENSQEETNYQNSFKGKIKNLNRPIKKDIELTTKKLITNKNPGS